MFKKIFFGFVLSSHLSFAQIEYPGNPLTGTPEVVFDYSSDACESNHSLDGPAHAVRDVNGQIRLVVPNHELYSLTGVNFDNLLPDCGTGQIFGSDEDSSQSNHNYKEWLGAPYTEDGVNFYALVHNEYHGYDFPGKCGHTDVLKCWYNSITLATSSDTGKYFSHVTAPNHLVASIPYEYDKNHGYRQGAFNPSNIIKNKSNGYYYAFFHTEAIGLQDEGLVVMRTNDLDDAGSWRMYDGSSWNTQSINPYLSSSYDTSAHVFHVVNQTKSVGGVYYSTYYEKYIMVFHSAYESQGGMKEGICFSLSDDLINWSAKQMIYYVNAISNSLTENSSWDYGAYPSLIDHNDTTLNFNEIGQNAFVYYTKWNNTSNPGLPDRDLIRVPVTFSKQLVSGFTVDDSGNDEDTNPGDGICQTPSGGCSLYAAIMESNGRSGSCSDSVLNIDFNLSSPVINTNTGAGYIPTSVYPLNIDATTNTGASQNTALMDDSINTVIKVKVDLGGNSSLNFTGGNTTIAGLCLSNPQNAAIIFSNKGNNRVKGCFIGVDISGTVNESESSDGWGVLIDNVADVTVGGTNEVDRNLIIGGIRIQGDSSKNIFVKGNFIGTDYSGTNDLEQSEHGISITSGASFVTIGGSDLSSRNVISGNNRGISIEAGCNSNIIDNNLIGVAMNEVNPIGNSSAGILLASDSNLVTNNIIANSGSEEAGLWLEGDFNIVQSNYFGTDFTETVNHGNNGSAIIITANGSNNLIGGNDSVQTNVIANSMADGIATFGGYNHGNSFLRNKIYNNGQFGIDISSDNQVLEEYTVDFSLSALRNDSLFLLGSYSGDSVLNYNIEFYANPSCDSDGYGEGFKYLGKTNLISDVNGKINFSEVITSSGVVVGDVITALITPGDGSTSEFNFCSEVVSDLPIFNPDSIQIRKSCIAGQSDYILVNVYNSGGQMLNWEVSNTQSWLIPAQGQGSVYPFDQETYQFNFEADGLNGLYNDTLVFVTNDPYKSNFNLPVMFYVTSPIAKTSEDTVYYFILPNRTDEKIVYIKNMGSGELTFTAGMGLGSNVIAGIDPNSGTVYPGDSLAINVKIKSNSLGNDVYNDFIWFSTNDPSQTVHEVQFVITVDNSVSSNEVFSEEYFSMKINENIVSLQSEIGFSKIKFAELYNINGQLLKFWDNFKHADKLEFLIDPSGVYYLKLKNTYNQIHTLKIIK